MHIDNPEYVYFSAEGGHQYLKEWLWWVGMTLSKYFVLFISVKTSNTVESRKFQVLRTRGLF